MENMIKLKSCETSTEEQETVIIISRRSEEAKIYCNDSTMLNKLEKMLNAEGSQWVLKEVIAPRDGVPSGYKITCPKGLIRFTPKKKTMTDEQKEVLRERMLKLLNSKAADNEADEATDDAENEEDNEEK